MYCVIKLQVVEKFLLILVLLASSLELFLTSEICFLTLLVYKKQRSKNLKELISPSLLPKIIKENNCSIEKCSRRCNICKNVLEVFTEFTCNATKRKYKIRGTLTCNTKNIIYLITCKCCSKQYVGSATGFKERFRIHKSDVNTGKVRCGVANHLLNVCKSEYLQVQLIEQVFARKGEDTIIQLITMLSRQIRTKLMA